ncbi:MAG: aminotransferase class I/II-fold pyridoxal phosphate-dependent enzyme [Candidatus Latescibacteria bacterium]|nr:aminotransferase class I/II-fold pyridoxal phosphate-dependent enzyme [Candidatus Latescibacterota bacterium]
MIDTKRLQRLPPYVFAQINEQKLKLRQQGVDVIDLGMGNPDQPAPPHIIEKLCEVVHDEKAHRYASGGSRGLPALRQAICRHYQGRFGVELDWQREVITTIGSKEGLAHICLALLDPGDLAVVPNPAYPIHIYGVAIAGGNVLSIPLRPEKEFVPEMEMITREVWPRPKLMIFNFPNNPTTATVDVSFFEEVVAFARKRDIIVIHDLAYSDIAFDGYVAPSFMQVPGAKEVGVEFFTMSKSYNMAGWRVGFCVGNPDVIDALAKIKGYMDYGIFTPIQVAAITALDGPQDCVKAAAKLYQKRRDTLVRGLNRIGWPVLKPRASMFVWAPIPGRYREMGSVAFAMQLMKEAEVAVSPGVGFGDMGEGYVRISLVENEQRIQQAVRNIKKCLKL